MAHRCHAIDCKAKVRPERLMCFRHWAMVPRAMQRAVLAAYRPGQCDDKRISAAWFRAAKAAIHHVGDLECKPNMDGRRRQAEYVASLMDEHEADERERGIL